jgi:hypothetical protein
MMYSSPGSIVRVSCGFLYKMYCCVFRRTQDSRFSVNFPVGTGRLEPGRQPSTMFDLHAGGAVVALLLPRRVLRDTGGT